MSGGSSRRYPPELRERAVAAGRAVEAATAGKAVAAGRAVEAEMAA